MAVNPSAFGPKPQIELSDGTPAVGGKLFFYVAGSVNTKQSTFTSSTGGAANTNPIVLNALGMPPNEIWWTAGLGYKVVYAPSTDTDPPTSPIWTIDNLFGINDTTVSQDQWVAFGGAPTFIGATSFSLVGDQTGTFQVGRRVRTTNTSGTIYSTITASVFGAVTTVTVVNDSGVLDSGLSAVSYGLLSPTSTSIPGVTISGLNWTFKGAVAVNGALTSSTQKSSMWLDTLATTPTSLAVNQHGTVSTAVVRFTRELVNTGADFTHTTAETLGSKIVINRAGLYAITANFRDGGGGNSIAITRNTTSVTTAPSTGGDGQNLASAVLAAGAGGVRQGISLSAVVFLAATDAIRLQQIGNTDLDQTYFNYLRIDAIL